jgi:hypothetical protein
LLPDIVNRRGEVNEVIGVGFGGFGKFAVFANNIPYCFSWTFKLFPDLFLCMAGKPKAS